MFKIGEIVWIAVPSFVGGHFACEGRIVSFDEDMVCVSTGTMTWFCNPKRVHSSRKMCEIQIEVDLKTARMS